MLTDQDFQNAATRLGCKIAAIQAVSDVESSGSGFYPNGAAKTLFEGHIFYKYTQGAYAAQYPNICYPHWDPSQYGKDTTTGLQEQARLELAKTLNLTAALMSASWGKFQVMGFNFTLVGFINPVDFVLSMSTDEAHQLEAFCAYVENSGLKDDLQNLDWNGFAKGYNGPLYQKNDYAGKLAASYKKFGGV